MIHQIWEIARKKKKKIYLLKVYNCYSEIRARCAYFFFIIVAGCACCAVLGRGRPAR